MGRPVRRATRLVGDHPLSGACNAAFLVSQCAFDTVAQDVETRAVLVGGDGVGHGLAWKMEGGKVSTPGGLPSVRHPTDGSGGMCSPQRFFGCGWLTEGAGVVGRPGASGTRTCLGFLASLFPRWPFGMP